LQYGIGADVKKSMKSAPVMSVTSHVSGVKRTVLVWWSSTSWTSFIC